MKIHIKNGHVVDHKRRIDSRQDIYLAAGKIVSIGKMPDGYQANRVINAEGMVVCSGLVDLSARLREPGFEYKATLESEMQAAIAGGVVHLVCPPDTDPPLDEPGLVEMLKHRAKGLNQAHVYPLGALTQKLAGERLTEMAELADAGCVGFSQADKSITDTLVLMRAMQYAATFGFCVWLRPQDAYLAGDGVAHDGEIATRLGLSGIPSCAETIALSTILTLVEATGVRTHICRLSSADSVEMIRQAKKRGLPVSCDVGINHIHLCDIDIGFFDSNCHLSPPLRSLRDRTALSEGLKDGTIDAICSDHTPVDDDAKQLPFAEAEIGATGLELLLPLTLKWAQNNKISLSEALNKITSKPAQIAGINGYQLDDGTSADICIFDPQAYWKIESKALRSQGKNTPFLGWEVQGKVKYTLVGGQIVYEAQ
jgi:dihydroorotase